MTRILIHNPLRRLLLPLGVGALVYLGVLLAFDTIETALEGFFTQELLFCIICSYLILEGNLLLLRFSEPKLTESPNFNKQVITLLAFTTLGSILLTSGMLIAYFYWFENMADIQVYSTELQIFNGIFLFVSLMYQGHFAGYYFIHNKFQRELEAEQKEKELLERSIDLFHYMMNPDFLMVGLESILLRIKEQNYELADEGILLLSDIYRHSLKNQDELVPIAEELQAMKSTSTFFQQFVSKHILLQIASEPKNTLIVPRTLTKLLEAIAYSQLSSATRPLQVNLDFHKNELVLKFESNFALTKSEQLTDTLKIVKDQYGWLNKTLKWKDQLIFSIYVPLEQPSSQNPTNHFPDLHHQNESNPD